jgi:hypothetical protein
MVRGALINLLLRALVKPIWRRAPSIDLHRRRAAMVDRRLGGVASNDALPCLVPVGRNQCAVDRAVCGS